MVMENNLLPHSKVEWREKTNSRSFQSFEELSLHQWNPSKQSFIVLVLQMKSETDPEEEGA